MTLFLEGRKRYSNNMRKSYLFFMLCLTVPAYAQKNLLPAVRAGMARPAGVSQHLAKGISAVGVPGLNLPPDAAVFGGRNVPAAYERIKRLPGADKFLLREFIRKQLSKPFLTPYASVTNWRKHQAASYESSLQTPEEFQATLRQIDRMTLQDPDFKKFLFFRPEASLLSDYSAEAVLNNKLLVSHLQYLHQKFNWMKHYPNQGRDALHSVISSWGNVVRQLAGRLRQEKLIMLGEGHYQLEVQQAVGDLILELKKQNPNRRIVVFSEFAHLPVAGPHVVNQTAETYYRRVDESISPQLSVEQAQQKRYARDVLLRLVRAQVEVYPLEDVVLIDLLKAANRQKAMLLQVASRNKIWARVMEYKMAQIRKTDPDALFIVYAGLGHVNRQRQYPLAAFFAPEKPVTVEFQFDPFVKKNILHFLWGEEVPLFARPLRASFSYWTGEDASLLARNSGFDYLVVVPHSLKGKLQRKYVSFINSL